LLETTNAIIIIIYSILQRRIPVFLSHVWGSSLLRFSRSFPTVENAHILKDFYKQKRPAMFVANHCSWMDIPYLGTTVGLRNYKLVSKKELEIIPILGTAIRVGGNIMVDRSNRKSQIQTLKQGINLLKVSGIIIIVW
jgi:1-acyl-sn-glycerol-3-phosphate acyltransferase